MVSKRAKDDLEAVKKSAAVAGGKSSGIAVPGDHEFLNSLNTLPKIELVNSVGSKTNGSSNLFGAHIDLNNNNATSVTSSLAKRERRDSGVGGSLSRDIG